MKKVAKELLGGLAMTFVCFATIILLLMCSAHEVKAETWTELGQFKITHYCNCPRCCSGWAYGPTASGVMPERYRTIAVDTSVIPMGTTVYIDGYGFRVAEDRGVKGNHIDVYTVGHQHALDLGVKYRTVWIVEGHEE